MSSSDPTPGTGTLRISAGTDLTEIRVSDGHFRKVPLPAGNAGRVVAEMPAGIYEVSFRDGTSWSTAPLVELWPGKTVEVKQPGSTPHPDALGPSEPDDPPDPAAPEQPAVVVVVHDRRSEPEGPSTGPDERLAGISLVPADESAMPAEVMGTPLGDRWARMRLRAAPGWWRLRIETGCEGPVLEFPVVVCPGWRTRVSMPLRTYGHGARRADPTRASVRMVQPGASDELPDARRLETNALDSLAVGRALHGPQFNDMLRGLLSGKFSNPMLGLFAGHLLPCRTPEEVGLLEEVIRNLTRLTRPDPDTLPHPDVLALGLRLAMVSGRPIDSIRMPFPPTLRAGWDVMCTASLRERGLVPTGSLTDRVVGRLWGPSAWVVWTCPPARSTRSRVRDLGFPLPDSGGRSTETFAPDTDKGWDVPFAFSATWSAKDEGLESSRPPQAASTPTVADVGDACARIDVALHHAALREWFRAADLDPDLRAVGQTVHPVAEDESRQQVIDRLRLRAPTPTAAPARWTVDRLATTLRIPAGTAQRAALDLSTQLTEQARLIGINLKARSPMARPELIIPYDPAFLGDGFVVPLPGLTPALKAAAFVDGAVIDYTHFSLVMNAGRRVAVFTAHNVDASRGVRGISGGLGWKMDERVGENQLGPEVYANNQLDRGHLVRREDVVWGTVSEARLANRSTYFYTNAAPQHRNFNQDEWVHLENWVLRQATDFSYRLCVFTGPVLREDDPVLTDLPPDLQTAFLVRGPAQIPAAFWKVVVLRDARAGGDDLSAVAFAMKQSEMWNDRHGSRLLNLRVHQVTLQAIEEWSGLDFGVLKEVDELAWSERVERALELGRAPEWPVIRSAEDLVFSGTARRARGLRAARGVVRERMAGTDLRGAERAAEAECGCADRGKFDAQEAIAALNQDIARLTDAIAALQAPREAGEGRPEREVLAEPAAPVDPALAAAQQRAEAVAAQAPEAIRDKVRDFAQRIAVQADVARGVIPPATPTELHRVIGGDLVSPGGFPSCCCIGDSTRWFCTGVVVAPTVVLTAAHCGQNITRVMVGGNKVTRFLDAEARQVAVRAVRVHPSYRGQPFHENDLNVLILAALANVPPTPLATIEQLRAATEAELVGFGYNDPERPLGFGVKRRVTVPLGPIKLSPDDDLGELPLTLGFHSDYEFVAGRKGLGKDSCNGDSGGPAYIRDSQGRYALAGLTSRATHEASVNCGDGGVYVRPDMFRSWIDEVLTSVGLGGLA